MAGENFGHKMAKARAAKRAERAAQARQDIATEHETRTPVDEPSIFSEDSEVYSPRVAKADRDRLVYCPAGPHYTAPNEMRGAICYFHKRHPKQPPQANVMILPPARPDAW